MPISYTSKKKENQRKSLLLFEKYFITINILSYQFLKN